MYRLHGGTQRRVRACVRARVCACVRVCAREGGEEGSGLLGCGRLVKFQSRRASGLKGDADRQTRRRPGAMSEPEPSDAEAAAAAAAAAAEGQQRQQRCAGRRHSPLGQAASRARSLLARDQRGR